MRNFISALLLSFSLLALVAPAQAQPNKKDPKLESGKNLRNTLLTMLRTAKEIKTPPETCNASGLLRSIPRSKLVPTKEELKLEIVRIVDSLQPTLRDDPFWPEILDNFNTSKDFIEFHKKVTGQDLGIIAPKLRKKIRDYYNRLKNSLKNGFDLKKITFKHKECSVTSSTNLKPSGWTVDKTKKPGNIKVNWEITTVVDISCKCNKKNKFRVQQASYFYTSKTSGRLLFDEFIDSGPASGTIISRFGLRFGKITEAKFGRSKLKCCPKESTTEDGSYIDPDENINDESAFIDTSVGVSFGSEEETEAIVSAGVLFKVAELGNNPLFIGPKAFVNTTALNGNDFKATRIVIGPGVEYKIPVGQGNTKVVTGINSGYSFGSVDAFGFEQTTSGFVVNSYAGVEVNIGSNLGLGLLLNFFEYNNTTFKAKEGDFKTSTSNTTFLTDRAGVLLGLRIGID